MAVVFGTKKRKRLPRRVVELSLLIFCTLLLFIRSKNSLKTHKTVSSKQVAPLKCAINFYGLPRAFKSLVLPSLVKNVIEPNREYKCDYFVHYHKLEQEGGGRSGRGGHLEVEEIHLLEEEVRKRGSTIRFAFTLDSEFWTKYRPMLDKIDTVNDKKGRPLYFPWKAKTYKKPGTTNNIIKMWHSIQEVWLMTRATGQQYDRVAMLRSDVVYVTPIDFNEYPNKVVVPGFARYPVSDRLAIGPMKGIEVWASQRFSRMDEHVRRMYRKTKTRGWGLHSERFINYSIFPEIRKVLSADDAILEHPTMCFLRARADESVWISDCDIEAKPSIVNGLNSNMQKILEGVLGRRCLGPAIKLMKKVQSLNCTNLLLQG